MIRKNIAVKFVNSDSQNKTKQIKNNQRLIDCGQNQGQNQRIFQRKVLLQESSFSNISKTKQKAQQQRPQGKIFKILKFRQQLMKDLKKQIKLQENIRNIKHQINPQEKQKLQSKLLKNYGITEDIFKLQVQQYDPFFKHNQCNSNQFYILHCLVDGHEQADKHWQLNMKKRYSRMVVQQFLKNIDSHQVISLNKFTKLVQVYLENQKLLRKKDIFAIYRRIKPSCTKQNILKELSSNYTDT